MPEHLTGPEARRLRTRHGWALQDLANLCGINKAYLSEFENGKRVLPAEQVEALGRALQQGPIGRAAPELRDIAGHWRLVFRDPDTGDELDRPPIAHISWTDASGMSYSMYVGDQDA